MKDAERADRAFASESPVPEAMGKLLLLVRERLGVGAVDRIWIFPPLVRGRKEWGLAAVSCRAEGEEARTLHTARYSAELTGQGMVFQPDLVVEGSAPPDLLPRVMDGVVRRSDLPLGRPREVLIEGDPERFHALLREYSPAPYPRLPEGAE